MAYNTGAGTKVAIGKESVWGTAVADTMLINFTSESMDSEATKTEEENLLAATSVAAYDLMGIKVAGDISAVLKPENAGFFMKAALGGTDTLTSVTGQAVHTMAMQTAAAALPSYTIFVDRKQAIKKYSGCKVNVLKLIAKAGDYIRATLSFKGKDEATGTITSTAVPSLKAYKFIGGTVNAGGTALDVTSAELSYENQLEDGPQTNTSGLYASEHMHAKRKITVAIEMPFETNAEAIRNTNLLTETVLSSVVLHFESPAFIATTYKYRMDITLNNVAVLEAKVAVGGAGILTMSIKGEATAVGATAPCAVVVYDATALAY